MLRFPDPQPRSQPNAHRDHGHRGAANHNITAPLHNTRTATFSAAINTTPTAKFVTTTPFPCLSNSPNTACTARNMNPPPACANTAPNHNGDTSRNTHNPSTPPSTVVASTTDTQTTTFTRLKPAPSSNAPSASPSGTLWTHTASNTDKSNFPLASCVSCPAASATPSIVL